MDVLRYFAGLYSADGEIRLSNYAGMGQTIAEPVFILGLFVGKGISMKYLLALLITLFYVNVFSQAVRNSVRGLFPLAIDSSAHFSYGAEVRSQYFFYHQKDWGESAPDRDGFMLARFLLHGDLPIGKHLRTFAELQSGLSSGEIKPPPAVNLNPLDLHQVYVEARLASENHSAVIFRLGRQELSYGSQRLVSLRDAPNNRQAFDGVKLIYTHRNISIDGFYTNYVQARTGIFDDRPGADVKFWGGYGVWNKAPLLRNIDLYYFGIARRSALFDDLEGKERRHSIGTRWWNNGEQWQYDMEGVYQFGKIGTDNISAYTISSNIAYRFTNVRLRPQIGIKTELISGDHQYADGVLQTFNPLFPRGGYFGLAALIGPSNLYDIHPHIQLWLAPGLRLTEDYDAFWRLSKNDGLYAISGKLLYSGKNTVSKYIGGQLGTTLEYNPTPFLYLRMEFTWFDCGKFLQEAGPGKDILMAGATVTYKF